MVKRDKIAREQILKGVTLSKYLEEIDLDSSIDIYDVMISHLVDGDLNDEVSNFFASLDGLNDDEKKDILNIVNKHNGLIFYEGDSDNWSDSVESMPITDYELISVKIIDNYNFLIDMVKNGGEEALVEMEKYKDFYGYNESSVVEYMRNSFIDDAVLESIITNMSKDESAYNLFTTEQKSDLLRFPEGTLYCYNNEKVNLINPILLSMEIYNRCNNDNNFISTDDLNDDESIVAYLYNFNRDNKSFSDVVEDMSVEYLDYDRRKNNVAPRDFFELQRDLSGNYSVRDWSINNTELGKMLETPYKNEARNIKK